MGIRIRRTIIVITEKEHTCTKCNENIPVGAHAVRQIGRMRSSPFDYSHYPKCEAGAKK